MEPIAKARLVVQGYLQKLGVDYFENFSPVMKNETIRILLSIAHIRNWKTRQLDVKTAFLNGKLKEVVYVKPPKCIDNNGKIWKLKKALYGLKQIPRAWNETLVKVLKKLNFTQSAVDCCVFFKDDIIIGFYVDDFSIIGANDKIIKDFIVQLSKKFEIKDLGELVEFLGVSYERTIDGFFISQSKMIESLLKEYDMQIVQKRLWKLIFAMKIRLILKILKNIKV